MTGARPAAHPRRIEPTPRTNVSRDDGAACRSSASPSCRRSHASRRARDDEVGPPEPQAAQRGGTRGYPARSADRVVEDVPASTRSPASNLHVHPVEPCVHVPVHTRCASSRWRSSAPGRRVQRRPVDCAVEAAPSRALRRTRRPRPVAGLDRGAGRSCEGSRRPTTRNCWRRRAGPPVSHDQRESLRICT